MEKKESKSKKRILVTAALPYINNIPHLGHIVGSHLPADIFTRYCRLKDYDVLFVGGSDENGTPAVLTAEKIGVDINDFLDRLHDEHKSIYDWFNISYDNFSRTSRKLHHETTKEFFKKAYKSGFIIKKSVKSFYCPDDERFLPDRYVEGTCAKCGYEDAHGDQCEKCGGLLETKELVRPKCTLCGSSPELRESEHLFLSLDELSKKLEKWLNTKKDLWRTQVLNWAHGWIKEGLEPRCITRSLEHGVKVPLEGFEDKVLYVWFDAVIGYISSTKEKLPNNWEQFWKDKNTKIFHFLGKDNIPFHTIFWPAMLIANREFNLPYNVVGLQYLNYEGDKFSKSKRKGVFCEGLANSDIDPDLVRAYLIFVIPETNDTEFRWEDFKRRVNSDIIGNYSNFINRSLSFIYNKLEGKISKPQEADLSNLDKEFIEAIKIRKKKIEKYFEAVELRKAFNEILALSTDGNKYFEDAAPWVSVKKDKERANNSLYLCANLCSALAVLAYPYLPTTSSNIWEQLNLKGEVGTPGNWDSTSDFSLPKNHKINKPYILFNKITSECLEALRENSSKTKELKDYFK